MAEHETPSSFDQAWSLIVLRSIADAVITSDADDRISFLNPAAEALTDWSLEEAGGRPITEVFRLIDETTGRPIDWPRTEVRLVKSVLLIRRDGRTLPIDDSISPIEDEAGRRSGTVVVFHRIDDRRRAEEELYRAHVELEQRVSERTAELAEANAALQGEVAERTRADEELRRANQALRALIHASPLAIIALDGQGRVTIWNPAAERMFGWGNRDVLGHPLPIVPEDLRQEFSSGLATSLQGGAHAGHETLRLKKDGSTIEVSLWTAPLYDARGEPCGRMGVIEDITDRKRAEERARPCCAGSSRPRRRSVSGSPASCTIRWGSTWRR